MTTVAHVVFNEFPSKFYPILRTISGLTKSILRTIGLTIPLALELLQKYYTGITYSNIYTLYLKSGLKIYVSF